MPFLLADDLLDDLSALLQLLAILFFNQCNVILPLHIVSGRWYNHEWYTLPIGPLLALPHQKKEGDRAKVVGGCWRP